MLDIFVSHASEDKDAFVRPLAHALKAYGLKVWFDEFSLRPGDSLRRSIDRGLAECSAGLVILSPAFFSKEWPQRELDALFSAEIAGRLRLIPVWYTIDFQGIAAVSPLLADRFAILGALGVPAVAARVSELFPVPEDLSGSELAQSLESYQHPSFFAEEALYAGVQYRFLQMNAFKEEYGDVFERLTADLSDEEIEDFPDKLEKTLNEEQKRLQKKHRIPDDVYLTTDEAVRELEWWKNALGEWASGTLTREESAELVEELDLEELDEYFILLEVPNFSISGKQRPLLWQALVELGCGFEDGYTKVAEICRKLREAKKRYS